MHGLANETWRDATVNDVVLSFLRAEAYKAAAFGYELTTRDQQLIGTPNLQNLEENRHRTWLLSEPLRRGSLLQHIPSDTRWFEVRYLRPEHLPELLFIRDRYWLSVASQEGRTLRDTPEHWSAPILWGHSKEGPFTILEGNTRIAAYARLQPKPAMSIPAYIGISTSPCYWHLQDPFPV